MFDSCVEQQRQPQEAVCIIERTIVSLPRRPPRRGTTTQNQHSIKRCAGSCRRRAIRHKRTINSYTRRIKPFRGFFSCLPQRPWCCGSPLLFILFLLAAAATVEKPGNNILGRSIKKAIYIMKPEKRNCISPALLFRIHQASIHPFHPSVLRWWDIPRIQRPRP